MQGVDIWQPVNMQLDMTKYIDNENYKSVLNVYLKEKWNIDQFQLGEDGYVCVPSK